jgi:hypothetical protein
MDAAALPFGLKNGGPGQIRTADTRFRICGSLGFSTLGRLQSRMFTADNASTFVQGNVDCKRIREE